VKDVVAAQILSDTVGACCKFLSHQDRSVVCNPVSIILCQFCQLSCTQTKMSYVTKRNYVIGRCCLVVTGHWSSVAHLKYGLFSTEWSCSQIQSSLGFVHLSVSVSLCEHSPARQSRQAAFGQQSQKTAAKQKWSKKKSRRKVVGVGIISSAALHKRLYRLVLDCGFALGWHLQSPVEDLSVL